MSPRFFSCRRGATPENDVGYSCHSRSDGGKVCCLFPRCSLHRTAGNGCLKAVHRNRARLLGARAHSCDKLCDSDAEAVVKHKHFTAGDQPLIDVHVDRIAGQFVKRHNRPFAEF